MKRQIVSWEKRTNEIMCLCCNEVNLLGGFWCQKERRYIDTEKEGFNPELFPFGDPWSVYDNFYKPVSKRLNDLRIRLEIEYDLDSISS